MTVQSGGLRNGHWIHAGGGGGARATGTGRLTRETCVDNGYEQVPVGHGRVRFTVIPARVPPPRLVPLLAFAATLGLVFLFAPWGALVRLGVGTALGAWVGGRVRRG